MPISDPSVAPSFGRFVEMQCDALIFDIDGVVLRTPHREAWSATLLKIGLQPNVSEWHDGRLPVEDFARLFAGCSREEGAVRLLAEFAPDLSFAERQSRALNIAHLKHEIYATMVADGGAAIYPDALDLIDRATSSGLPCGLISASVTAESTFRQLNIPQPSLERLTAVPKFFGATDRSASLRELGVVLQCAMESALVVDDAPRGVAAAVGAGARAIGVARLSDAERGALVVSGAAHVVESLEGVWLSDTAPWVVGWPEA